MRTADSPLYVGVDVGGTKITGAVVRRTGQILERQRRKTPREGSSQEALRAISETIAELLANASVPAEAIAGIGLGVPGIVDPERGRVVVAVNANMSNLKVSGPLEKRFGVRVALDNDVNLGTLGECWLGAAQGASHAVGIFVGTGIGGGIVANGRLVQGAGHAAGEIGHIVMQIGGPPCGCGNRGCLEALASRSAIERGIREAVKAGRKTVLTDMLDGDFSVIKSKALERALKEKDRLVTELMREAAETLGYACITVRHMLDPEVIVLGGGVIEACGDFMMPIIRDIVASDAFFGPIKGREIVRSKLGDDAVVLGAVALAQGIACSSPGGEGAVETPEYPTVKHSSSGEVTVGKEEYGYDFYIRADGKVKKRKKKPIKSRFGTSHKIGAREIEKVLKGDPEVLFIGTGQEGSASLTGGGEDLLRKRSIRTVVLPSPQAVRQYSGSKERKALLIHVTC